MEEVENGAGGEEAGCCRTSDGSMSEEPHVHV